MRSGYSLTRPRFATVRLQDCHQEGWCDLFTANAKHGISDQDSETDDRPAEVFSAVPEGNYGSETSSIAQDIR
jgi:hypothetical protein